MSLRHTELLIPNENPFANCKLDRKKYAEVLTDIVASYSDGFVLAINNQWGAGKTTFVKMWQKHLEQEERGYKTIYFNAWENDFENNPFIAITSEIDNLISEPEKSFVEGFLNKAAKITKSALPSLLEHGAKKYLGESFIEDLTKDTTDGVLNLFSDELIKYSNRKNGINEFKKVLEEYVQESTPNKPLIFIIDELDRCRPNYAVEVLENIKHLFSVKGIVFVLSIDKAQLGHAVRGVYGSEQIDANEYLKRFIDLEYSIPKPNTESYIRYLYEYYGFTSFFKTPTRVQNSELSSEGETFVKIADILFSESNMNLRQIERIFTHSRLTLKSFAENNYTLPQLYLFLIYLKHQKNDEYKSIQNKLFSLEEIVDLYWTLMKSKLSEVNERLIVQLGAIFLYNYFNYYFPNRGFTQLLNKNEEGNHQLTFSTRQMSENQTNLTIQILTGLIGHYNLSDVSIDFLLNKIDLTERFKS
jgi:hypothetical protein